MVVTPDMLINAYWPTGNITDYCEIVMDKLPFQTNKPTPATISHCFNLYMNDFEQGCSCYIIATNASKTDFQMSIAAVNDSHACK